MAVSCGEVRAMVPVKKEVTWSSWRSHCAPRGRSQPQMSFGPAPTEIVYLGLLPWWSLAWAYSHGGQRSLAQACSLGGLSLVPAQVEVPGLGLLQQKSLAQACFGRGLRLGLISVDVPGLACS